ncbi:unnamed protein product [Camellia sinensis]
MMMEEEERLKRLKRHELIEEERKKLLIEEVFLRLPPPSVARFKSISKWWRRYLSEPPFVDRYEARNLSVLGFFYQTNYKKLVFRAIPSNPNPNPNPNDKSSSSISISTGNRLRTGFEGHIGASDNTLLVINSSNGLLLLYYSMPVPYYEVYNPTTGDKVSVRFSYDYETFATRYMVFGFAFDPYSTHPCFTIVDIADTGARKFRVFSMCSGLQTNVGSRQMPSSLTIFIISVIRMIHIWKVTLALLELTSICTVEQDGKPLNSRLEEKMKGRNKEVVTREYTINLHKHLHSCLDIRIHTSPP